MIHAVSSVVLTWACTLASSPAPAHRPEAALRWREQDLAPSEVPTDFPDGARTALEYWAPWAAEHDYKLFFTNDARVVVLDKDKKLPAKEWKLVEDTLRYCDELMPLPERTVAAPAEASSGEGTTWSYGDVVELEHDTAVYFRCKNQEDYDSMLAHIAEREGRDSGWVSQMKQHPGLLIYRPLAGAVVKTSGQEEWDPQNEMVNRIARLLAVRRFGRAPHWLTMGIAWNVEYALRDTIYCYPYRDSFVGVAEHGGWQNGLESQFKRKDVVFDFNRLASWKPGAYDDLLAGRAWGTVCYLHTRSPGAVGRVLEDLRLVIEEKGRVNKADGTWQLIPDYEPSPEDQLAILKERIDPKFLEELCEFFRKGMRAPKAR